VNLERAVRIGDPLGGHWVQGHVDAVATIGAVSRDTADVRVEIEIPPAFRRYVAEKGSLAVDGVSLTVAAARETAAVVALVPYTLSHTIASEYAPGGRVNLEVDIVARYLEKLLEARGYFNEATGVASAAGRTR
jgi:riboflavin synthase